MPGLAGSPGDVGVVYRTNVRLVRAADFDQLPALRRSCDSFCGRTAADEAKRVAGDRFLDGDQSVRAHVAEVGCGRADL